MTLRFDPQDGVYDASNETVRFFGYEDDVRLTFAITGVALRDLAGLDEDAVDDAVYCRIFSEHRHAIEEKAASLWQAIKADHERQGTAPSTIDPIIIPMLDE
ncbi:DUF1488 family protein [Dongia soli]|uniref:DUF1488 family protein n=1 Tax=Dongia soli TaxID=600628 RepID=A0ABU5E8G3_9PROT|nr:DUF1488 family protein [Dongia soli]MDY0882616.1 DUF1488 family protein [Dongia soli]